MRFAVKMTYGSAVWLYVINHYQKYLNYIWKHKIGHLANGKQIHIAFVLLQVVIYVYEEWYCQSPHFHSVLKEMCIWFVSPLATKCFICHISKFRVYRECAHEVLIALFSNFVCTINSIFQRRVSGSDLFEKMSGKEKTKTNKQANRQQQRPFPFRSFYHLLTGQFCFFVS